MDLDDKDKSFDNPFPDSSSDSDLTFLDPLKRLDRLFHNPFSSTTDERPWWDSGRKPWEQGKGGF